MCKQTPSWGKKAFGFSVKVRGSKFTFVVTQGSVDLEGSGELFGIYPDPDFNAFYLNDQNPWI